MSDGEPVTVVLIPAARAAVTGRPQAGGLALRASGPPNAGVVRCRAAAASGTRRAGTSQSCGCLALERRRAWGRVRENIMPMLMSVKAPSDAIKAQSAARFRSAEHRALVSAASRTHGLSGHPLYGTWRIMRRR
jgi:hypothetical protein